MPWSFSLKMKILILDSGPIINLSMNGLLYLFEEIKKSGNIRIILTDSVKKEVIDRPMDIPRFELGAIRVDELISENIFEMSDKIGISNSSIMERTQKILNKLNSTIKVNGKFITIVSEAECSCLALSQILNEKGIENLIAIDERTTRAIFEKPENLIRLMQKRLHKKAIIENNDFRKIGRFKFIRSSEIVFVAHKKNMTHIRGKKALEALIYATKYKGCAISDEEINQLKKL